MTRSTGRLPWRSTIVPASTLPTPAMIGTSPTSRPSAPSESANFSWSAGIRVTSAAKHTP